jgi:hypothetical protein
MKPVMGGYTLLEVMLFLAISSILLAISNVVLQGQSSHTEFVAGINDVNSKMQQWVDEVKNGYSASSADSSAAIGNYNCSLDGTGNPVLAVPSGATAGNGIGANLPCIFLGRAIVVNDEVGSGPQDLNNKIYAYTVLGRRSYDDGSGAQVNVNSLQNANTTAAVYDVGSSAPAINLTEQYIIPNGIRVRHVYFSNTPDQTNILAGFYIDPSNGANSLRAVQYPLNGNINPTDWAGGTAWDIPKCINLNLPAGNCQKSGTPDNLWPMGEWDICMESTRNDERAKLRVISTTGEGAITKLEVGKTSICS